MGWVILALGLSTSGFGGSRLGFLSRLAEALDLGWLDGRLGLSSLPASLVVVELSLLDDLIALLQQLLRNLGQFICFLHFLLENFRIFPLLLLLSAKNSSSTRVILGNYLNASDDSLHLQVLLPLLFQYKRRHFRI